MLSHLIKLSVEQAFRTTNGWICDVAEHGLENCTERFVHEDELLKHLGADAQGLIEQVQHVWCPQYDCYDERFHYITLTEWVAMNAGIDLEVELAILINKREDRTISAPLPDGLNALDGIAHLVKSAA